MQKSRENDARFCSNECRGGWVSETYQGEGHPLWGVEHLSGEDNPAWKPTDVECAWCGGRLDCKPCRVERSENVFCDMDCRAEWLSENNRGDAHPNYRRVTLECEICGDEFERPPSRMDPSAHHYCSKECSHKGRSMHYAGENNPNWSGGRPSRAGFTESLRETVRERDGFECQYCGLTQQEHLEQYGTRLHVHHIIPRKQFDNPRLSHRKENLVSLCHPCHKTWEKIPGLRPQRSD